MKYKIISFIILFAALILANLKLNNFESKQILINEVFPYQINDWHGEDIKASEATLNVFPHDEFLFRKYEQKKIINKATIAIVISNNRDHLHKPTGCYKGQGIKIIEETVIDLDENNKINLFIGRRNKKNFSVLYWFSDLNNTFTSNANFSMHVRKHKFWNKPLKGMALVVINSDTDDMDKLLNLAKEVNKNLLKLND